MADKTETKVEETKAEKFKRLAESRTGKALTAIAALGGLAAKANYDYTPEQWEKIYTAMLNEINKVKAKVDAGGKEAAKTGFAL